MPAERGDGLVQAKGGAAGASGARRGSHDAGNTTDADRVLEARLIELETRLAFQEHALAELSDALAATRADGDRTNQLLASMLTDLRKVRTELYADPSDEPPPPHY